MARTLILLGVGAILVAAAPPHWSRTVAVAQTLPPQHDVIPVPSRIELKGGIDRNRAWMVALHKGLTVRKVSDKAVRSVAIDLQYRGDAVAIDVDAQGIVSVSRGGKSIAIDSPDALARVQALLGGSEAVFAARLLHADREGTSDLTAPDMSLLTTTALVASLVGDTDAPRRLTDRFVQKHRGIFRPVRMPSNGGCWMNYSRESTDAWNELQSCMDEANQDESFFNGAYRRLACNGVWMIRAESAWFEYLNCLSPVGWK